MDLKDTRKTIPALILIILLVGIIVGIVLVKRQQSATGGAIGLPTPASTYLKEDFNRNGIVDEQDLLLFKQLFAAKDPKADLDGSGKVNALDASILLSNFGKGG